MDIALKNIRTLTATWLRVVLSVCVGNRKKRSEKCVCVDIIKCE